MKQISKNEAMYLANVKGLRFHEKLFKTTTKKPTYYCIEEPKVLRMLDQYRKGNTTEENKKKVR